MVEEEDGKGAVSAIRRTSKRLDKALRAVVVVNRDRPGTPRQRGFGAILRCYSLLLLALFT